MKQATPMCALNGLEDAKLDLETELWFKWKTGLRNCKSLTSIGYGWIIKIYRATESCDCETWQFIISQTSFIQNEWTMSASTLMSSFLLTHNSPECTTLATLPSFNATGCYHAMFSI